MATFFNQASISFNGHVTNSNVTVGEVLDVLSITKSAISSGYGSDDGVVYAVSIVNSGTTPITAITLSDDLGTYTLGTGSLTPLDYTDGSLKLYVNGVLAPTPTVTPGPPLTVSGINLPADSSALILYEARTNAYAPLAIGSEITNTVTVTAEAPCVEGPITASGSITAEEFNSLSIAKCICPDVVSSCEEISYRFIIQNAGNDPVVATDDVIIRDVFSPALTNLVVTFNGESWTEGVNYTYDETTGEFVTLPGSITVPAATFTQDPVSGVVTATPGTSLLTISGTV